MNVTISLTPLGLERVNDVIGTVYQYLQRMQSLNDDQWKSYFSERAAVREMKFNFKGKEKSYGYSRSLAMNLQRNFPRDRFLECHGGLILEYDGKAIKECLKTLTVDNCFYQIVAKEVEGECKEEEKWYGTKFKREEIDGEVLGKWKRVEDGDERLHTPKENKYIATDFSIHCDKIKGGGGGDGMEVDAENDEKANDPQANVGGDGMDVDAENDEKAND